MGRVAEQIWTSVEQDELDRLYEKLRTTKSQLALALSVLLSLGFELSDFV